ncbi:MAG: prepilin-type N-terminal cleavage/methylation domain-containing protein [Vallitaleaceae bacterium]|nr:prepilin-type N-terminal cleavage/methylation domain-containing protein [Vallitaleaceae bacterium]
MKKLFSKVWKKEEGFTLIELIIVIAILAIIAAIAIPNVLSAVDNSRRTTDISNSKMIADAIATVKAKEDTFSNVNDVVTNLTEDQGEVDSFAEAVANQLNSVPTPKFKGADADTFYFSIAEDGTIEVYAATGDVTTGGVMVYPIPDTTYENQ